MTQPQPACAVAMPALPRPTTPRPTKHRPTTPVPLHPWHERLPDPDLRPRLLPGSVRPQAIRVPPSPSRH
ncbi:hypothetical protein J2792_002262 [Novosphingobium capsulatum]|uniref:Uncharacterized protein n=1 Tax=Novosphingobium capsulatum TaxID=13688 RepID=A0ABU1MM33_9SPHN|nr:MULTISPECIES: hypothetical protein [Novosphingobium]MDR6511390.1 hypothetical protein [Novosphingobium capsulatum]WQD91320.1 hypothetical protein U0041_09815 [Novosphingobium capsulatum]